MDKIKLDWIPVPVNRKDIPDLENVFIKNSKGEVTLAEFSCDFWRPVFVSGREYDWDFYGSYDFTKTTPTEIRITHYAINPGFE